MLHPVLVILFLQDQSTPMLAPWLAPNCSKDMQFDLRLSTGRSKKLLIACSTKKTPHTLLLFQTADLSFSSLGSFSCFSSRLKIKHGGDHGSYAMGRNFVFNFRLRG